MNPYQGNHVSLTRGEKVPEVAVGAVLPDQVLLSMNFCPRPGPRQKVLLRNSGGAQNLILNTSHPPKHKM